MGNCFADTNDGIVGYDPDNPQEFFVGKAARAPSDNLPHASPADLPPDDDAPAPYEREDRPVSKRDRKGSTRHVDILKTTILFETEKQEQKLERMFANQRALYWCFVDYYENMRCICKFAGQPSNTSNELLDAVKTWRADGQHAFLNEISVVQSRALIKTFAWLAHKGPEADRDIPPEASCTSRITFAQDFALRLLSDEDANPRERAEWLLSDGYNRLTIPMLGTVKLSIEALPEKAKGQSKTWKMARRKIDRVCISTEQDDDKPIRWVAKLFFDPAIIPAEHRSKSRSMSSKVSEGVRERLRELIAAGAPINASVAEIKKEFKLSRATIYREAAQIRAVS